MNFEFLTRSGCGLCDQARPLVLAAVAAVDGSVEEIDVDHDDRLLGEYGLRIPVLLGPQGEVVAEGVIDQSGLGRAMRGYRRRR